VKKIYLAGPDVFRPDAPAWGLSLKALCREFGFDGLFPLDNAAPEDLSGPALATWIYEANIALIRKCDLVMANLAPFRGYEPDSGTAFEVALRPRWASRCGRITTRWAVCVTRCRKCAVPMAWRSTPMVRWSKISACRAT
jgi:hypothetical protein